MGKFANLKNGQISSYSLCCGYVDKRVFDLGKKKLVVELYMEQSCYHVKVVSWDIVEWHKGALGIDTDISNPMKEQYSFYGNELKKARGMFQEFVNSLSLIEKEMTHFGELVDNFHIFE